MAERACLPRHPGREAVFADRGDPISARALNNERAGQHSVPGDMTDRLGLASQDRLIEAKIGRR